MSPAGSTVTNSMPGWSGHCMTAYHRFCAYQPCLCPCHQPEAEAKVEEASSAQR